MSESYAAAAAIAAGILADQVDARGIDGLDDLGQRFDDAADSAVAGFHALYGRKGNARPPGQRLLVDTKKGSGSP